MKKKTNKTPIYKEIWFWLLAASVVLFAAGILIARDDAATGAPELAAAVRSVPSGTPDTPLELSPAPDAEPKPTSKTTPTPVPETSPTPKSEQTPEATPVPSTGPAKEKNVPEQPEELSQHPYVGSTGSNKYHRPTCRYCGSIREDNLVYWDTVEEAEEAGYTACKVCKPN